MKLSGAFPSKSGHPLKSKGVGGICEREQEPKEAQAQSRSFAEALETLKQMASVGLRLCNSQLQPNALLPSGSVYFLNINSRDRFKACLEIKHIIM